MLPAIEAGQAFKAELGFAQDVEIGNVTVRISLDETIVYEGEQRLGDGLQALNVDLSPFAGAEGTLALRVSPRERALSSGLYWLEPRVERQ